MLASLYLGEPKRKIVSADDSCVLNLDYDAGSFYLNSAAQAEILSNFSPFDALLCSPFYGGRGCGSHMPCIRASHKDANDQFEPREEGSPHSLGHGPFGAL